MQSRKHFGRALVVVAAGLAAASGCFASDGTITISGNVKAETCSIASQVGNTAGTSSFSIPMPSLSTTTLGGVGTTAGRTRFSLLLTGCNFTGSVYTFFEHGSTVNSNNRLSVTPANAGFDIQLLNSAGTPLTLQSVAGSQGDTPVAVSSNAATLTYYAQYFTTGTVNAGAWSTTVNYSIVYP